MTSADAGSSAAAAPNDTALQSLIGHVDQLGKECPWTAAQQPEDMLFHLRKELIEVEEVLRAHRNRPAEADPRLKKPSIEALVTELGDVLFDALMLIEVAQRDTPAVTLEACAASSNAKLRRRAPYIFPGGAHVANLADAERVWQQAKQEEGVGEVSGEASREGVVANQEDVSILQGVLAEQRARVRMEAARLTEQSAVSSFPPMPPPPQPPPQQNGRALANGHPADHSNERSTEPEGGLLGLSEWEQDFLAGSDSDHTDSDIE